MFRIFLPLLFCKCLAAGFALADPFFEGKVSAKAMAAFATRDAGKDSLGQNWMVSAANPLAVDAGATVLARGGTAADAMVAVQAVLGLVEPQSSGLGGGAFLVWYDAKSGQTTTLDGRETAPLAVTPDLFLDSKGKPLKFFDAVVGGRSVGVPATPALLEAAHRRWGNQDWAGLFADAKRLARDGFAVSPRLSGLIAFDQERLSRHPNTARYFLPNGRIPPVGYVLRNPAYAQTLDRLQRRGADAFATGPLADEIVHTVTTAPNRGVLSTADLALYQIKERPPVCVTYRAFEVCGMGPPSSGGLTVGQILKLVEPFDLSALGPNDPEAWRLIGDAQRLAFADRGLYMADEDFVPVPKAALLADRYLSSRAKLLRGSRALETVAPGNPAEDQGTFWAPDQSIEFPSTSHISIVDRYGNALSMTTTVENLFGSRLMAGGFVLNNELTDFSFQSERNGKPIANRVQGGKRPRSSMSPTIVLKDGKPVLVLGSPGGSRISGFVAQTLIAHLDWGMPIQAAISMPRLVNRFGTYEIEESALGAKLDQRLRQLGYQTKVRRITSGLHGIAIGTKLRGGADPRREGIALGD